MGLAPQLNEGNRQPAPTRGKELPVAARPRPEHQRQAHELLAHANARQLTPVEADTLAFLATRCEPPDGRERGFLRRVRDKLERRRP